MPSGWKKGDKIALLGKPEGSVVATDAHLASASPLKRLMDYKDDSGRYLVRYRYQWWAIYHVLVRQCGFPEGYHDFAQCIAQLFPEGLRVPCMVSTLKQLSQTRYMQPLDTWHYDALYHGSPERYRLMERTVRVLEEMMTPITQWK